MIEIKNLIKTYGTFKAVDGLDLISKNGKITILLGPNGAGKSTTIKSVCGLLKYQGEITIDGHENHSIEAKRVFGYIPETPNLYDNLTVIEHIKFIQKAYDKHNDAYVEELLKLFELDAKRKTMAKELSKGMKQKLSMLLALITEPNSLLVDEPMIGLDPMAIENVLELFKQLKAKNMAILISTHIIDVIEDIYDEAYIMVKGQIKAHVIKEELSEEENLKDIFFKIVSEDKTSEAN